MEELKHLIKKSISEIGLSKTKELINNALDDSPKQKATFKCLKCELESSQSVSKKQVIQLLCEHCESMHILVHGRCRTLRKSGRSGYKKISLRYYDSIKNEFLFEYVDETYTAEKIELKSGDEFNATVYIHKGTSYKASITVQNKTTQRTYTANNTRIYNLEEQFPELKYNKNI